jgi:hypothetical protein
LQQESGFWQQESALQHSFFSTHSVFGQQASLAHSPLSAFLQQQLTAQIAMAAINKIFFITLKKINKVNDILIQSYNNMHQNLCKSNIFFGYMQKKL